MLDPQRAHSRATYLQASSHLALLNAAITVHTDGR